MMNKTLGISAALLALSGTPTAPALGDDARPFQLVYHSDTRGYYRPCG
jgi:hypothetical protein